MNSREDIFNQALAKLAAGHSKQDILASFNEANHDMSPLLDVSRMLLDMPKAIVPTPLMQRKYALSKTKLYWLKWSYTFKFAAVSSGLMLLLSAGAFTAYAARNSLPGNSLFALKRAEEKTQLIFAMDPQAKANLQIAFAQKRLDEAQQIFSNPSQNSQQAQTAALTELSSQTTNALAAAAGVTQTDPQAQSNKPLLNSLEDLTQKQQSLLKQIKSDKQIQTAAQTALTALNNNTKQLSQIKQAMTIADNSQALAQLNNTSTMVTVLGVINTIQNGKITVEKITFNTDPQTVITNNSGDMLRLSDLSAGQTVNAIGKPEQNMLVATQILLTDGADSASGSTTTTTTIASIPGIAATTTAATESQPTATSTPGAKKVEGAFTSKNGTTTAESEATSTPMFNFTPDPNVATGGFIIEDPAPKFHP
ncbi:MAG: DUF5666 domain-containing protein [Candidatus Doudnabacteria bacterium]|nr:DUF5666 domain-containing protein [Candidatus Doudnabacteria bacterium]